jgi:hypothetical protein
MIKAADASNKPPDTGFEYLLAKVSFTYGSGGTINYTPKQTQFVAYSADNKAYSTVTAAVPKPALSETVIYPGNASSGWILFMVSQNDAKPLMLYSESTTWFQLYQ